MPKFDKAVIEQPPSAYQRAVARESARLALAVRRHCGPDWRSGVEYSVRWLLYRAVAWEPAIDRARLDAAEPLFERFGPVVYADAEVVVAQAEDLHDAVSAVVAQLSLRRRA